MRGTHVVVVGGGIAGTTTAAWLAAHLHGEAVPAALAELRPDRFERTPG